MAELTRRYVVMTVASEIPFDPNDPDGVFVLKPWKDPAALRAVQAYRDNCYPELARDLDTWITAIVAGPSMRGDVGRRNDSHLRATVMPASATAAPSRRRRASGPKTTRATRQRARKMTRPHRGKRKKRTR
jgi:hypothetical protein